MDVTVLGMLSDLLYASRPEFQRGRCLLIIARLDIFAQPFFVVLALLTQQCDVLFQRDAFGLANLHAMKQGQKHSVIVHDENHFPGRSETNWLTLVIQIAGQYPQDRFGFLKRRFSAGDQDVGAGCSDGTGASGNGTIEVFGSMLMCPHFARPGVLRGACSELNQQLAIIPRKFPNAFVSTLYLSQGKHLDKPAVSPEKFSSFGDLLKYLHKDLPDSGINLEYGYKFRPVSFMPTP